MISRAPLVLAVILAIIVCASCAHAVADARCPVCRSARDRLHRHSTMQPLTLVLLMAALFALATVVSLHVRG